MNGKDWVTLTFSASALLVSVLSFYFANVRVDDSAIARLVNVTSIPGDESVFRDRARKNGSVIAKFAFANTGNRPAVLLSAEYKVGNRADLKEGTFGHFENVDLVLPPREVRVGEIHIPIEDLIGKMSNGMDIGKNGLVRRFFAAFTFNTVDSQGVVHESPVTKALVQIDVTSAGFNNFGLIDDVEKFPTTELFRK
jgi:hypothetical protein